MLEINMLLSDYAVTNEERVNQPQFFYSTVNST